jgi:hypothetical protein
MIEFVCWRHIGLLNIIEWLTFHDPVCKQQLRIFCPINKKSFYLRVEFKYYLYVDCYNALKTGWNRHHRYCLIPH